MPKIRVLLADDVADIRLLLRLALEREEEFEVVGEAGTGNEAVEMSASLRPDVIVLDMAMPEMDGLQAIPEIRKHLPDCRILVWTAFESRSLAASALALCADAYLEKGGPVSELPSFIQTVHSSPPKCGILVSP